MLANDRTNPLWLCRARQKHCPGCNAPDLIPGPRGGCSQNFYCTACNEGWNFHGVTWGIVGVDAIGKPDPAVVDVYRNFIAPYGSVRP